MNAEDIMKWCQENIHDNTVVDFPDDLFHSLDAESAQQISTHYGGRILMRLPAGERGFFDWLQQNDPAVWDDLWSNVDEQPYVVSLAFLPAFLDPSRGFPICDLEKTDNYFFVPGLVQGDNAKDFVEAVRERFIAKQKLTVEQLLALECSLSPIDIWHFAWHHGVDLARCKQAVQSLVDDQILLHLKTAEEIAGYIE